MGQCDFSERSDWMQTKIQGWKKNLYILWFCDFLMGMGFQLSMPFMSLYIKTLGQFNQFELNIWSGLAFSATYFISSWMAPIWGKIADSYGRKKVMLISTIGDGVMVLCMGFVHHAYQLALFRLLQGFFAGYVANTSALIAAEAPSKHSGKALSTLSTGITGGMLIGPLFGGAIASIFGYRLTFILTGLLYLIVFVLTVFLVQEHNFIPISKKETLTAQQLFQNLKHPQIIFGMLVTTLIVQAGNNSIAPVISLYVQHLLHGHGQVDLMSGLIAALPGIATIFVAPFFGEWGDRIGTQKILIGGLIFAIIIYIPQAFVINVWQLAALRFLVGISDAALLPQVQSLLAKYSSSKYSGRIFSYNQSAQFMGNIVGPLIGSTISGIFGYGGVFLSTAFLVGGNLVWLKSKIKI